jgi:hypothetical protein
MTHSLVAAVGCSLLPLLATACATAAARSRDPATVMRTGLIEGEKIERANSCSRYAEAKPVSLSQPVFGSCFLTNVRFIFEESAWAKALATAAKILPTGGDFGLIDALGAGATAFNAYYVLTRGAKGELAVVERDGRIFVPRPTIRRASVSGSRSDLVSASPDGDRWLSLETGDDVTWVFEIYDLPPDTTGLLPDYLSREWAGALAHGPAAP